MKKTLSFFLVVTCASFFFLTSGCNSSTDNLTTESTDSTMQMINHPDMAKVKTEIQAIGSKWADAENARDARTVADFFADDAIRLVNGMPMISGKANILKSLEDELANTPEGTTLSTETLDVFGNEKDVVEVGRLILKDSTGKTFYTGKYMTYWQKRDGKYLAVRDMTNDDEKSN